MPARDYALKQRARNPKALSPILRLQPPRCLPRLRPPQLRRPVIWLRLLGPPDGTRARHGFTPQILSVGSPRGAVHDGPVSLAGRGGGPKVGDLQARRRFVVLVGLLCEEVYAIVLVAWLHADGLRGDVAFVLV